MLFKALTASVCIGLLGSIAAYADAEEGPLESGHHVKHVLLISVDGLHALDLSNYVATHPALKGRVLFTNAKAGAPDAAFVEHNDATPAEIDALVKQGYIVRTRSDADTKEGRTGDTTQRDRALRSGAQLVSTDYPWYEPSRWTGYSVSLPSHASVRCNPVNAPKGCSDAELADAPVAK